MLLARASGGTREVREKGCGFVAVPVEQPNERLLAVAREVRGLACEGQGKPSVGRVPQYVCKRLPTGELMSLLKERVPLI